MTWQAYANNAPDMRNAQMNDALVEALDPHLDRIALKKIANHKSTALEPQITLAQLVEKVHQEDITRTHIDWHKIKTNCTLSSSIKNLSFDIDHLAGYGIWDQCSTTQVLKWSEFEKTTTFHKIL